MSPDQLKRLFPHASESTLRANALDREDLMPHPNPTPQCAPRRRGSGCEDRWAVECLPALLRGSECVHRQFRVMVSPDDAVVPVNYTADFAIWTPWAIEEPKCPPQWWRCVLWEVKDKRRKPHSDELIRPKLARLMNPWISEIWLATWDGKQWETRQLA